MKSFLLLTALLTVAATAVHAADDKKTAAEPAKKPAGMPAFLAPAAEEAKPAAEEEKPAAEEVKPALPAATTPQAVIPEIAPSSAPAIAAPIVISTPTAPAPAPVAAAPALPPADVITAATYTRDLSKMYDDLSKDAKDLTDRGHKELLAQKKTQDELQSQIDALNKQIDEKGADKSKDGKKAVKQMKKDEYALEKQLKASKKESARTKSDLIDKVWAMQSRHYDVLKARYKEVVGNVKAAD